MIPVNQAQCRRGHYANDHQSCDDWNENRANSASYQKLEGVREHFEAGDEIRFRVKMRVRFRFLIWERRKVPSSFVERVYPVCSVYTGISGGSDVSINESRLCSKVDKII